MLAAARASDHDVVPVGVRRLSVADAKLVPFQYKPPDSFWMLTRTLLTLVVASLVVPQRSPTPPVEHPASYVVALYADPLTGKVGVLTGATVSTVHGVALVAALVFPATSVAVTVKVCGPLLRLV
jgi:hypothetical protein